MASKFGIIGLGSMGYGIAQSVLRAGHQTFGYDVMPTQQKRFINEGGSEGTLQDLLPTLDGVMVVVLNAAQTEDVLFGSNGIVSQMKAGSVIISCATVPPKFAVQAEERCTKFGIHYLDAPISGGATKAAEGKLSIMASGSQLAFETAKPLLDATAETVFELGDKSGAGSAMKAVNQMLAGTHIAMMAEAMTFGMTQGIGPDKFLEVISKCAGTSWMLENRAPHIIDGDYTPRSSVDIWPKDLGIVLDIAESVQFKAPITSAALQQFLTASEQGLGKEDDAAVAKVYASNSNLTLPRSNSE